MVNSTNLFSVLPASVLVCFLFINITFMHFSISLLVVLWFQHFILFTSLFPAFIHLVHSGGIHLAYSVAIFSSLATRRFNDTFFATLLFHAAASTHLSFSDASFPINSSQLFYSSLITILSSQTTSNPEFHLQLFCHHHQSSYTLFPFRFLPLTGIFQNYWFFLEKSRVTQGCVQ